MTVFLNSINMLIYLRGEKKHFSCEEKIDFYIWYWVVLLAKHHAIGQAVRRPFLNSEICVLSQAKHLES